MKIFNNDHYNSQKAEKLNLDLSDAKIKRFLPT